jgi:hypothetical protein
MPSSEKTLCVSSQVLARPEADRPGGTRPSQPDGMPKQIWELTVRCWAQDPKLRPKFSTISKEIERMYNPGSTLRKDTAHTGTSLVIASKLTLASTDSSENETAWATASEGDSEQDQQYVVVRCVQKYR